MTVQASPHEVILGDMDTHRRQISHWPGNFFSRAVAASVW